MKAGSAQAESCCVYVKLEKCMQHIHGIISKLFDCWADPYAHLLILKSSMVGLVWIQLNQTVRYICCSFKNKRRHWIQTSHTGGQLLSDLYIKINFGPLDFWLYTYLVMSLMLKVTWIPSISTTNICFNTNNTRTWKQFTDLCYWLSTIFY